MAVLVAAAVMVLSMLVVSAPAAFAQGVGGGDPNPGGSEDSQSNHSTPPTAKPGTFHAGESGKNGIATGVGKTLGDEG
jgi:hypothetical protein